MFIQGLFVYLLNNYTLMSQLSDKAIAIAVTQLDKQEDPKGSNWGHPVQDYLHKVGIDFPASWCMAFVYWSFDEAAKAIGAITPLVKTGGVLRAWNEAGSHHVTDPQPGDIFIMDFGHGLGHTGIVESVEGSVLHTIEGNTNDTGSREGYEVCRRQRSIYKIKGYLRY